MSAITRRTNRNTSAEKIIVQCPCCEVRIILTRVDRARLIHCSDCGHMFVDEELYDEWDEQAIMKNALMRHLSGGIEE